MANIQIYANTDDASIHFDGSTVKPQPLGSCLAIDHPTEADRIIIQSTILKDNGEIKTLFKRFPIHRIENQFGIELDDANNRTQITALLNIEFSRTLDSTAYNGGWYAASDTPDLNVIINPLSNSVTFQDGIGGDVYNTYHVNELSAVIDGAHIDIVQDSSSNIQFVGLLFNQVTINGATVGNNINDAIINLNAAFSLSLVDYASFLSSEVGITGGAAPAEQAHFYFIESPDGVFNYPLFKTATEANDVDTAEGGGGTSSTTTFVDDLSATTWNYPTTGYVSNGTEAPLNGVFGTSESVVWNTQVTDVDGNYAPTGTDLIFTVLEGSAVNIQIVPTGNTNIFNVTGIPAGFAFNGTHLIGTADVITDAIDIIHTLGITEANNYGSDVNTLTITVSNDPVNDILASPSSTPFTKGQAVIGSSIKRGTGAYATGHAVLTPMRMNGVVEDTVHNADLTKTAVSSRPWMQTAVVQRKGLKQYLGSLVGTSFSSKQIVWSIVDGYMTFKWGNGNHNVTGVSDVQVLPNMDDWGMFYMDFSGVRNDDFSVQDCIDTFRFFQVNNASGVASLLAMTWTVNGTANMTTAFTSESYRLGTDIRGIGNIDNGAIYASASVSTLRSNVTRPSALEIGKAVRDPLAWLTDYKEGNLFRKCADTYDTANFQVGTTSTNFNWQTHVFLMGDGASDTYTNTRNQVYIGDSYTNILWAQPVSGDLVNISIDGIV